MIWTLIAVTILQFDQASVTTVGILVGLMFFVAGLQSMVGAAVAERHAWVYGRPDRRGADVGPAFWTAGQFFIEKACLLLVFAGIWALLRGVTDFVRAFQIRQIGKLL